MVDPTAQRALERYSRMKAEKDAAFYRVEEEIAIITALYKEKALNDGRDELIPDEITQRNQEYEKCLEAPARAYAVKVRSLAHIGVEALQLPAGASRQMWLDEVFNKVVPAKGEHRFKATYRTETINGQPKEFVDFTVVGIEGTNIPLSDFAGKVTLSIHTDNMRKYVQSDSTSIFGYISGMWNRMFEKGTVGSKN
jgi:hypothetical protein